jgi:hypothetical protein
MPGANQLPGVRNGEPCPGCGTGIWGAQPKKCFICGYDFENPNNPANLQGPATDQGLLDRQAAELMKTMDEQKEIEVAANARLEGMVNEYLKMEWPDLPEDGTTREYTDAFLRAARMTWPEAKFYGVETEVWFDTSLRRWVKRIRGNMDLPAQRVVGFRFDYALKRDPDNHL